MTARIIYFHGLSGGPNSIKTSRLLSRYEVEAPRFPYSKRSLSEMSRPELLATVTSLFVDSEKIAREAVRRFKPQLIVASSLGARFAMMTGCEARLPLVLLAPVWNNQIKWEGVKNGDRSGGVLPNSADDVMSFVTPSVAELLGAIAGFHKTDRIPPRTFILHSEQDEVFDLSQSRTLLRNNPLPPSSVDAAFMESASRKLTAENLRVEDRLIIVGGGHQMNDTRVLDAMMDAVEALLEPETQRN